jgi:hypothetical protein
MSLLSRLLPKTAKELEIPTGTPFPLAAGRRLRATAPAKVFIPTAILEPTGTPLSKLVQLSNKSSDVGLVEHPQRPRTVSALMVVMDAGEEICLGRSSEILVEAATTPSKWEEL